MKRVFVSVFAILFFSVSFVVFAAPPLTKENVDPYFSSKVYGEIKPLGEGRLGSTTFDHASGLRVQGGTVYQDVHFCFVGDTSCACADHTLYWLPSEKPYWQLQSSRNEEKVSCPEGITIPTSSDSGASQPSRPSRSRGKGSKTNVIPLQK